MDASFFQCDLTWQRYGVFSNYQLELHKEVGDQFIYIAAKDVKQLLRAVHDTFPHLMEEYVNEHAEIDISTVQIRI